MIFDVATIPCLSDNYAFLLHSNETGETALIDAPESGPILRALDQRGWQLSEIWLTHHHSDHIDATAEIGAATGAKIVGAQADAHRLPPLNKALSDNDTYQFAGHDVRILDVSGHTIGHIAFHVPQADAVFTADSLMALGCGRLFEGSAEQMWASLSKLAALPPGTIVYSGHEYTATNGRFAMTIEPNNERLVQRVAQIKKARALGQPTVPSTLEEELATNPFLRASNPTVKAALNMSSVTDSEVFREIRRRKDAF